MYQVSKQFFCILCSTVYLPISLAERFKVWVCGPSFVGIAQFEFCLWYEWQFLGNVVCCHVEIAASG
jgi:hypothetical protein